jgi:acetyltransferase-like isoleucine patch superfamily enzyme
MAADPGIAAGAWVAPGASLGEGVVIEPGAVIHEGVVLGAGVLIEACAVLGKRPRLRAGSSAAASAGAASEAPPLPLVLGDGETVCAGAVVYAGASIGDRVIVGDQSQVRERARIGAGSVIGRGSSVDFDAVIGMRVLIQTGVYVTAGTIVEDDVFLGPGVCTTNDSTMGRLAPGTPLRGPVFRRACRVGGGAVIVPGVEIGEEAFIAAGAVVTGDVEPRAVVMGIPGRVVRFVGDEDLLERWR